ncbi:MAG: ABC transporter permease [Candidatus Dormibacteria bacterium]
MKAFRALTLNTIRSSLRNRTALFFTLGLAVLFMVIFGILFNNSSFSLKLGIVDDDKTTKSQAFIDTLAKVDGVTVDVGDLERERAQLKDNKVSLVVTLPKGFECAIQQKNPSCAQGPVGIRQTSATSQTPSIAAQVVGQVLSHFTGTRPAVVLGQPVIDSVNPITAIDFFLPGMIAYIVLQSGINYVAIGLVELRVRKVLRRLRATPLSKGQILGAQVLAGALTVALQIVVLVALGLGLFHAHNYGNWLIAVVPIVLGIGAFVGIGFLLTSAVRTSEAARGLASAVAFPMMFLSGIFFPSDQLPATLQTIVRVLPLPWLTDALRQVMNDGAGLGSIALDCVVLAGWAVVALAIATWRFRWD